MTTPTATTAPAPGGTRLPAGELRRQVAEMLTTATTPLTPVTIANMLGGKSSGAVGNALATLTAKDEAAKTGGSPVMYRATAKTAAAAKTATTTPRTATTTPRTATTTAAAPPSPVRAPVAPAPPVTGPVPRPNGQLYHPRNLAGIPDVTALRKLRDGGVAALMYGPPGTGKTSVVEAAFPDLITIQGDGDTIVADFVGDQFKTPHGTYEFLDGPLVTAMRDGRPLFIDDATLIPPTVLAVVYPAMDGRRQITIKGNYGETVDAADGFYVVAGHNPGVHGAVLTDALSSRFSAQIKVTTDYDLAAQLGVNVRAVRVARTLATSFDRGEIGWAPQLRELLAFERIAAALGVNFAAGNLIGTAPDEDRDTVATVVHDVFGPSVEPLALGAHIT
ncbi:AAA family ATPase [Amycolatopsis sp. H20-H5]|uniref:AAA family ATPase n=1 Tax=Amycolatopsis sp. H20-H5 TaxID=3046309 RepID=UPI002DB905E3|nr:AAA family ATPase [Amycolatopsis sp. H20-H5]MEC3978876.1 AAA family ATPase [Amycolatopsis sp. H20-H5]